MPVKIVNGRVVDDSQITQQQNPQSPLQNGPNGPIYNPVGGGAPQQPTGGPAPGAAPQGGPGNCPQGQVWHAWPAPGRCEAEDALSKAGQDTCNEAEHPQTPNPDCYWCDFSTQKWVRGMCSADAPGAGGNAGGARATSSSGVKSVGGSSPAASGFDAYLQSIIKGTLDQGSRYTPEALQALQGENTRQYSNEVERGTRAVQQNAAQRGMQRAGSTGAAIAQVRAGAESQRGQRTVGIMTQKINADFQDKITAVDRAQNYLNSLRDNEYRYTLVSEQRSQFDANLALAYAQLAQQRSNLQMQMQSQWDMMRAQQGFGALMLGV